MLGLLLIIVVVWVLFGVIGAAVHALLWFLIIAAAISVTAGMLSWLKRDAVTGRHRQR